MPSGRRQMGDRGNRARHLCARASMGKSGHEARRQAFVARRLTGGVAREDAPIGGRRWRNGSAERSCVSMDTGSGHTKHQG